MEERKYLAYLHHLGLTQVDLRRLCGDEGRDVGDIYKNLSEASLEDLGVESEKRYKILEKRKKFQSQQIDRVLYDREVRIILESDEEYPKSLREIPHSPYILYVRGILPQGEMFAVVGSRTMTS
ncbi:DNA-protecting protein DprA [Candidatus Gracilibacteria bacterium]|nr:DNA-protecting protein DprA [Candidatus Gracilibacteria bacterium]